MTTIKTKITTNNTSNPKVLIAFYGVISRSLEYTYDKLKENLIDVLKSKYQVDIYGFNNNVHGKYVDGIKQNNNITDLIKYTVKEEKTQDEIDSIIKTTIKLKNIKVKMVETYKPSIIKNCIRQMYSEEQIGKFIENHKDKYDCVVVCGPDYYLLKPINIRHVNNIINKKNYVYTADLADVGGYTNGFYIGQPSQIIKIISRFSILDYLLPTDKNYEYLLKRTFLKYNIERRVTDIDFIKIRSDKSIKMNHCSRLNDSVCKYLTNVDELNKILNISSYNKIKPIMNIKKKMNRKISILYINV